MTDKKITVEDFRTEADKKVCDGCRHEFGAHGDCMTRCFVDACALNYQRMVRDTDKGEFMGVPLGPCFSHAARNLPIMRFRMDLREKERKVDEG